MESLYTAKYTALALSIEIEQTRSLRYLSGLPYFSIFRNSQSGMTTVDSA